MNDHPNAGGQDQAHELWFVREVGGELGMPPGGGDAARCPHVELNCVAWGWPRESPVASYQGSAQPEHASAAGYLQASRVQQAARPVVDDRLRLVRAREFEPPAATPVSADRRFPFRR